MIRCEGCGHEFNTEDFVEGDAVIWIKVEDVEVGPPVTRYEQHTPCACPNPDCGDFLNFTHIINRTAG